MPIPQGPQQNLPIRYSVEWTRGGQVNTRPVGSYQATSQNLGGAPPTQPQLVGSDTTTFSVNMMGDLDANDTQTLQQSIAYTSIPPIRVPAGYELVAQTSLNVNHNITGLNVASAFHKPVATMRIGGQVAGPIFPPGGDYTGWGGYLTLQLTNSLGSTISAGPVYGNAVLQLWLYNKSLAGFSNVQAASGSSTPLVPSSYSGPPGNYSAGGPPQETGPGSRVPGGTHGPNRL